MIKIIKEGQLYAICPKCGCEFEYEREDLSTIIGYGCSLSYVPCPCCGERIIHPVNEPDGCLCEENEKK